MKIFSGIRGLTEAKAMVYALLLVAIIASSYSFGASLAGERAKSAAPAAGKISGQLIINGSSPMVPMITEIAKRFEALHPGTQIEVNNVGAVQGLKDLREGKASIAMMGRALNDMETDLVSYPVARDAVCGIVHRDNPIKVLTSLQVADIHVGRIVNWSQVGGRDATIDVINGVAGSGGVDLFARYFNIKYDQIKARMVQRDESDRIKTVAENRNAISYVSISLAERNRKAGVPIKLLPAEGVSATAKTLRSGNYPISRPMTLVTLGTANELTRTFIRYTLSRNVTATIEKHDFVPYAD